jgi:hypothetical protein
MEQQKENLELSIQYTKSVYHFPGSVNILQLAF